MPRLQKYENKAAYFYNNAQHNYWNFLTQALLGNHGPGFCSHYSINKIIGYATIESEREPLKVNDKVIPDFLVISFKNCKNPEMAAKLSERLKSMEIEVDDPSFSDPTQEGFFNPDFKKSTHLLCIGGNQSVARILSIAGVITVSEYNQIKAPPVSAQSTNNLRQ